VKLLNLFGTKDEETLLKCKLSGKSGEWHRIESEIDAPTYVCFEDKRGNLKLDKKSKFVVKDEEEVQMNGKKVRRKGQK
jgi:hypothetical protein